MKQEKTEKGTRCLRALVPPLPSVYTGWPLVFTLGFTELLIHHAVFSSDCFLIYDAAHTKSSLIFIPCHWALKKIQWITRRRKNNIELISIHPSLLGHRGFALVDLRPAEDTELNHNELFKRVGKMEVYIEFKGEHCNHDSFNQKPFWWVRIAIYANGSL